MGCKESNQTKTIIYLYRFRPAIVKECIHQVLVERLHDKSYDGEEVMEWSKSISDEIKNKLKGILGPLAYKGLDKQIF